ncbi:ELM1/GtrOC1 family putative glycosyltransferase [Halioxenophilus aromaticivorans]
MLNILVIYDGKAGHLSQSQGLAQLIAKHHHSRCNLQILRAKPRLKLLNKALQFLAQYLPATIVLCLVRLYRTKVIGDAKHPAKITAPNLFISFGGNSIALNIAYRRYWRCRNIVIGNNYNVGKNSISAHLTAFGSPARNAIATGIALSKIDRENCNSAATVIKETNPHTRYWGVLIGGNGSGYEYQQSDWQALSHGLNELSQKYSIHWLICDSRRTPQGAIELLNTQLGSFTGVSFIGYNQPQRLSIEAVMGASERLFCTEDSLSMLSEAVAMAKPVISLQPQTNSPRPVHARMINHIVNTGLVERQPISQLANYQINFFFPSVPYEHQTVAVYSRLSALGVLDNTVASPAANQLAYPSPQ